jgi:hypothetical protein
MLLIVPSLKGHFLNYIEIFKLYDKDCDFFELKGKRFKVFKLFWFLISTKHKQITFLHGEISIIQSMIMSILFFRKKFSLLFYYGFSHKFKENKFKYFVYRSVVNLLIMLSVKLLYLEGSVSLLGKEFYKKFIIINDPVLIDFNLNISSVSSNEKSNLRFLIPGYLDDRKCIIEIIQSLKILTSHYPNITVELLLLGQQSSDIKSYMSAYKLENTNSELVVIERVYRFTDDELREEVSNADCIFSIYKDHIGSSGVVISSIAIGKPVLFIPIGVLSDVADEMHIKNLPASYSISDINSSLTMLLSASSVQYSKSNRKMFLEKRSKIQFKKAFYE